MAELGIPKLARRAVFWLRLATQPALHRSANTKLNKEGRIRVDALTIPTLLAQSYR